jgi:hypothetical protein
MGRDEMRQLMLIDRIFSEQQVVISNPFFRLNRVQQLAGGGLALYEWISNTSDEN